MELIAARFVQKGSAKLSSSSSTACTATSPPTSKTSLFAHHLNKHTRAARTIQSAYRGYLIRKKLKQLLFHSHFSANSIVSTLDELVTWHYGWMNQFQILFLLLFFLVTVYFQVFSSRPSAYDTDSAFMARMDLLESSRESVSNSYQAYDFMRHVIDEFGRVDAQVSAKCLDLLSILCPLNLAKFKEQYGTNDTKFSQDVLDQCQDISRYSGYVDNSNRMVGTIYAYQTRRTTKPCTDKMRGIDPYVGNVRQCLTDEFDKQYLPRIPKSCTTCNAFDYQSDAFFFALTGDAFNLPIDFMKCRVDGLEIDGWLDFRTSDLCFLVTMLDTSFDGRIIAYKECFTFEDGGKVSNVREMASVSFLASQGNSALLGLTITSIILISARQLWVLGELLAHPKQHLHFGFLFRLVGPGLELAANGMFIQYLDAIGTFTFEEKMTKEMFYTDTFAYLREFEITFALANNWSMYTLIASLGLFFRLADVVLSIEFHPSSALVSAILRQAGSRLVSFFFVFALFILVYSFIGMILFSRTTYMFADFGRALNTLMLLFLGEGQDLQQAMFQASTPQAMRTMQLCYFWVFVAIATVLLMSVLLAIIVGAFVEISDQRKQGQPMLPFLTTMWEAIRFGVKGLVISVCCCRSRRTMGSQVHYTPLESLLSLKLRYRVRGGCNAAELRPMLHGIYSSSQTVERILNQCRAQTKLDKLLGEEMHLRGLDPTSATLQGLQLGKLESIETRLKQQQRQLELWRSS